MEAEQREFVRAAVEGRVLWRRLEAEESARLAAQMVGHHPGQVPPAAPSTPFEAYLLSRVKVVEAKLDAVLDLLAQRDGEEGAEPREGRLVNLSASGLVLTSPGQPDFNIGDALEIRVYPAEWAGEPVRAVARVTRSEALDAGGWEAALSLEAIDPEEQERLVGYTFQRLRQVLQQRQREEGRG